MTTTARATLVGTTTVARVAAAVRARTGAEVRTVMVGSGAADTPGSPGFVIFADVTGRVVSLAVVPNDASNALGLDAVTVLHGPGTGRAAAVMAAMAAEAGGTFAPDESGEELVVHDPPDDAPSEALLACDLARVLGPDATAPVVRALSDPGRAAALLEAVSRHLDGTAPPRP